MVQFNSISSNIHYLFQSVKWSVNNKYKLWYRFSAFWLRSKCSICSYQLNIWYEGHGSSSMLNWFLDGDRVSAACCGSIMCWPCIAVPQGTAHFPIKTIRINILVESISNLMMIILKSSIDLWSCYPTKQHRNVFCNLDVDVEVSQLTENIFV